MTGATRLTASIIDALQTLDGLNGIYPHAEAVPDGAPLPCLLVNIDAPDSLQSHSHGKAKRERTYTIQAVFKRGATEEELNNMAVDIMTALGFGQQPFDRPIAGMDTDEQEITYTFASAGSGYTSVTLTVTFNYVETYEPR